MPFAHDRSIPDRSLLRLSATILSCVVLLSCGTPTEPEPEPVTLRGAIVRASDGTELSGVVVAAGGATTTTTASGFYSLSGLAAGATTVTATLVGFENYSADVTLNAGPNIRNVTLVAVAVLSTDPNLKVAFVADQGLGPPSVAVLRLIADEGADMVLHQGDFDYVDDPAAWDAQINSVLGTDFPYFASIGNHDDPAWDGPDGYQALLAARLSRVSGAECTGDLGVQATCRYRGLHFILSGVGTRGSGHDAYIAAELASDSSVWSICTWHKNQAAMQVGWKEDEVGWEAYDACLQGGAIVATGHEHSYSRTHLMDSFGPTQSVASTSRTLVVEKGRSFAFVSGLGGRPPRAQQRDDDWWASIFTSTQGASSGALFCTFHVDDDPNRARCYFKSIDGDVVDRFDVVSAVNRP